jgi:Tfp pilus assembly protein FimT
MSMIEILIVTAIISILAVVTMPRFTQWLDTYRIDAESQRIYFDLMLARYTAIKNNSNVIVTFTLVPAGYAVHEDSNNSGTQDANEPVKTSTLENNVIFGINSGLLDVYGNSLASAITLGGGSSVTFNGKGEATVSGSVYVLPRADLNVKNIRMRAVSILQSTGNIKLWRYTAGAVPGPWE